MTREDRSDSVHSFPQVEKFAFVEHLNETLNYSINPQTDEIFEVQKDGILFSKYIQFIDSSLIRNYYDTFDSKMKKFQQLENQKNILKAAVKLGCSIVNISSEDLLAGRQYLVFGVLWQLIRAFLMKNINCNACPELVRFGSDLPPEQFLLKWVNWHLEKSECSSILEKSECSSISNFGSDLTDSKAYIYLLASLVPDIITKRVINDLLQETDLLQRASLLLSYAKGIAPTAQSFLKPEVIVSGSYEKLNLCFIASLFNSGTGMAQIHEELEGKINRLENELSIEKDELSNANLKNSHLLTTIQELREEIERLTQESSEYKKKAESHGKEVEILQMKFSKASDEWRGAQEEYEKRVEELGLKLDQTSKQLRETHVSLMDQRRQAETIGDCAESLSEELESFRSKQERLEFLVEHLKIERVRCDHYSVRLRQLYKTYPSAELLARAVYTFLDDENISPKEKGKLYLDKIRKGSDKTGFLTKKARKGTVWSMRYFVLRDNFVFYYKNEFELKSEPKGVTRLDDCSVEFARNPTEYNLQGQSILMITIPDHGHGREIGADLKTGKVELYLAGSEMDLQEWKRAFHKASSYWIRRGSLKTIRRASIQH